MTKAAGFDALFESPAAFGGYFERGLEGLLDIGGMNLFILVAANASFDATLWEPLAPRLQNEYERLGTGLRAALAEGRRIEEADDDLLVFLKMSCIGLDHLHLTEQRLAGPWEVQFNQLRSFRPLRNSQRPMRDIRAPFDADAFNFNKPFMQQENLASGELLGRHIDLYYNKYPFVALHSLLVPERDMCHPQYLFEDMHHYVWKLVRHLAGNLPGIRVGYNAMGAFASVNHLHLQLFVRDQALPVESGHWTHNGGERHYPVECRVFDDAESAWACIQACHEENQAYNLLYAPGRLYCMPRRKQGDFDLPSWSNGFSWYELCGGMITFNHQDWAGLDEAVITESLGLAGL